MQSFIDRPDELLKEIWNDKNVHIVQKANSLGKDKFCLIDISMNAQGQDEDKMYIDSSFYRSNIRRGNTLVELNDKGKKKLMWGRKGTEKIIDIRLEYIDSVTRSLQLTKDQRKAFDVLFKNVNMCLQKNKRVELIKTQKANGENAQVSYFYQLDAWIICSKNVSILASSPKDLDNYDGKRYTYAKAIAKQWFKQIQNLNKEKLLKLKKLLDGYTIVGQYCGNPEYQHLILYDEVRIVWFAMIDNYTEEYCLDPFEARRNLEEFGFKFVKLKRMGSWNHKREFFQNLEDLYLRVAEASMEDQQYGMQGSIVYFLEPGMKGNKPHSRVLGSGKLKTIEYRFFRKIRQKLSRYLNKKDSEPELLRKYQDECAELQKANNAPAPFPQLYYSQILQKGCELIRETKIIQQDFLRSKFVSILKLLFYVIDKSISLKDHGKKLIRNEEFLDEVTKIPLKSYGTMGCSTKFIYIDLSLPYLIDKKLSDNISNHFSILNLPFKHIDCSIKQNDAQKVFMQINTSSKGDEKQAFLMHFYLSSIPNSDFLKNLSYKLKYKSKKNVYHQIVFLTEKIGQNDKKFEADHEEYPFKLETIVRAYWQGFQTVKNTPTIQEKIDVFKNVSERLRTLNNVSKAGEKQGVKKVGIQMSASVKMEDKDMNELETIVKCILTGDKQYENYCRLILRLEKYTEKEFPDLSKEDLEKQTIAVIKSNFTIVPEVDFTDKKDKTTKLN